MIPGQVVHVLVRPVVLSCSATGTPPINIVIIRNLITLVNTTNTASIRVTEEGNYTCLATNKYGNDKRDFVAINGEDPQIIDFSFLYGNLLKENYNRHF